VGDRPGVLRRRCLIAAFLLWSLPARAQPADPGRRLFEAGCAPCHGGDGAGGEKGPGILEPRDARRRQDLRRLIRDGIPDAGMPAFPLPDADLDALARYVAGLIAPAIEHPPAGDARSGERFFFGGGGCARCHRAQGQGGFLGPDLSNLGRERPLRTIELALRRPGARKLPGYAPVTVQLRGGGQLRGLLKNESNYDLQLLSLQGQVHLLARSQVDKVVREPASLMPPVSASAGQLRDLLAFLGRLQTGASVTASARDLPAPAGDPFAPVRSPRPGEWPTYHGQLGGNRHSPLRQIDPSNVATLSPRWLFPVPEGRRLEVTPLVVDGVMYVTAANQALALDPRTGRQLWRWSRPLTRGVIGDAGNGINRGAAVLGDRLFLVTDNARLVALHRGSGRLLWDVEIADYRQHYGTTSAPLVVKDLVVTGTSGGDEGARGLIVAHRAATGERVWRFWTMPAPGEPKSETWVGRAIEHGCSAPWLTGSYDPAADLIYWTTGNPCPDYNGEERKGDNLYSNSVVALDPAGGKLRWYYQYTPHDLHDWDAAQTPMLIDAPFGGRPRKLLAQANRNGFFYVLDRLKGELLLAKPFVKKLTWASGIGADGRPQLLPDNDPTPQGTKSCPAVEGATNWMSTAFSPETGLFYVMALEKCSIYYQSSAWWEPGKSFYGGGTRRVADEVPQKVLRAIELATGRIAWEYPQIGPADTWGGVLSTASGLVFFGDDSGALAAVDARSGRPLWHFHLNAAWKASPMTYQVDGRQYVAVAVGSQVVAFGLPGNPEHAR
jgi:alcohol dehydrogenase (cytochrome c)